MLSSFGAASADVKPARALGTTAQDLHWLAAHGLPIPAAWVLDATAFELVLSRTGADRAVAEMRWRLTGLWDDLTAVERVMRSLEERRVSVARALRGAPLPDALGRRLEELVLRETLWMIRTSPVFEDQVIDIPEFSLAGVRSGQALWDGIRQVWASTYRRRVLEHCAQHDAPVPSMAIVLHPIDPISVRDRSGTVYSRAPWSGVRGPGVQAIFGVLQNGRGRGYGMVCGRWVSMRRPLPMPEWAVVIPPGGGTVRTPYPSGEPLNGDEATRLVELAKGAAEARGRPVALDFIWPAGGEPVLLRMREEE
jgi:hypothetical protein